MTDEKRLIWVSEHDALRADMNDLAAAMGVLDSQLAAGKALTAWQVRACGESDRCSAVYCATTPGTKRFYSSGPPALPCCARDSSGEQCARERKSAECVTEAPRVPTNWTVSLVATDGKGPRVLFSQTPPDGAFTRRVRR
jgi:hypothetical protein